MVQEMIETLAEIEGNQIRLKELIKSYIRMTQNVIDEMEENDNNMFNIRQEIELQIVNN